MNTKLLLAALCFMTAARAAELAPQPPAPTQSAGTPQVLPRPDSRFEGNVGRTYLESDTPQFPQPVKAPKGAPNVVLILLDDAGFGQFSTFGGGTPSPTMDKLAAEGLRFNRFHTTALCSPTRAALLTGRNHHSVSTGVIGEIATGYDGGGAGKGGKVTLLVNDAKIADGRLERTVPAQFSLGEGMDIGMDHGSAVDLTYKLPFKFTGKIDEVRVELE